MAKLAHKHYKRRISEMRSEIFSPSSYTNWISAKARRSTGGRITLHKKNETEFIRKTKKFFIIFGFGPEDICLAYSSPLMIALSINDLLLLETRFFFSFLGRRRRII